MSALSTQILVDSPLGYWPLDETSGTSASDRSGNARTITLNAGETRNVIALAGLTATTFPGSDDGGASTDAAFAGTGDCSVSLWLKWTGSTLYTPFAWRNDATNGERLLVLLNHDGSGVVAGAFTSDRGGGAVGGSDGPYNDGRWRHFGVTVASNVCTMYVNGVQVAQATATTPTSSSQGVRLGVNGVVTPVTAQRFNGSMTQVAAYGSALTTARIKAHYEAGIRNGVSV